MLQVPLAVSSTCFSTSAFWDAVLLYHNRPHLVNRKIVAASQVLFYKITFSNKDVKHISELLTKSALLYEIRKLKNIAKEDITEDFIRSIVESYDKNVILASSALEDFRENSGIFVSLRILMPRNKRCNKCIEVVTLDKNKNTALFLGVSEADKIVIAPPFPYEIELTSTNNLRINLDNFEDADTAHAEWIADKLFTKLLKWGEDRIEGNSTLSSLSLVSVDEYCSIYGNLKSKYGDDLIKEWPKRSNTNPQKYVFEDLAIATYLICLWKKYTEDKINFVDCGCGNGLLVYILNQEGYSGYGLDLRRRPIWDIYPQEIRLEVGTVTPSSLFPECNWIIGNHSDELTPWIPVISLRSSPQTNFFVLPCCPYDFSGQKYIRSNISVSQYSDYLGYIQSICNMCGFNTDMDKLRIPSTKRTCLVGIRKKMDIEESHRINNEINKFIELRLSSVNFKPRCETEKVRNCTQLDKGLIQNLIFVCVSALLETENYKRKENGDLWNKGTSSTLSDLSKKMSTDDLKQLKKECGGIQTLLRNHRYLFEFVDGKVFLREPFRLDENTKKYKDKPCWFLKYHPNGCLYSSEECAYKH